MRPILKLLIGVLAAAWRSLTNQGHHRRGETGRHDGIPPVTAPARKAEASTIPSSLSGPMRSDCGGRSKSWTVAINVILGHLHVMLDDGVMLCDIRPGEAAKLAAFLTKPDADQHVVGGRGSRQGPLLCRWHGDKIIHITRLGLGLGACPSRVFGYTARLTEDSAASLAKTILRQNRAISRPPGDPCLRRQRRPR